MITKNMLRTYEKKTLSSMKKKIRLVTAFDLIRYHKQIKYQRLFLTCAPISV